MAPTVCRALGLRLCWGHWCIVGFSFLAVILVLSLMVTLPVPSPVPSPAVRFLPPPPATVTCLLQVSVIRESLHSLSLAQLLLNPISGKGRIVFAHGFILFHSHGNKSSPGSQASHDRHEAGYLWSLVVVFMDQNHDKVCSPFSSPEERPSD